MPLSQRCSPNGRRCIAAMAMLGCLLLTACGGGGSHSSPAVAPTPVPTPPSVVTTLPEGLWAGTVTPGSSHENLAATCYVLDSGEVRIMATSGLQMVGNLVAGVGTGKAYHQTVETGLMIEDATFRVTAVTPGARFSGSYEVGPETGTFSFQYNSNYDTPIDRATLPRSYKSASTDNSLNQQVSFQVFTDGTVLGMFGPAMGSLISGTYTIPNPAKNLVKLDLTVTVSGQPQVKMAALASVETAAGSAQPTLVLAATSPSLAFLGKFK